MNDVDIRQKLDLRPVINVSGTMTGLGASIVVPEAVKAIADILPQFVEIDELQKRGSRVIGRLCNAEAGFLTSSCSAAITIFGRGLFAAEGSDFIICAGGATAIHPAIHGLLTLSPTTEPNE